MEKERTWNTCRRSCEVITNALPVHFPSVTHAQTRGHRYLHTSLTVCLTPVRQGSILQARLVQYAEDRQDTSWLAEWWNTGAYLHDRGPTVFFVSYFYHFADTSETGAGSTQTGRAANLLAAALRFRRCVVAGTLPPDRIGKKGTPLCSAPFKYM